MMEATEVRTVVAYGIQRLTRRGQERTFWGDKNDLYLNWNLGYTGYTFVKTQIVSYDLYISLCVKRKSKLGTLCEWSFVKGWVSL